MTEKDIVLIYDNCPCHNGIISGWYMRSLPCIKITICPYTPEFNPIELLFNNLKWRAADGVIRNKNSELAEFLAWNMN